MTFPLSLVPFEEYMLAEDTPRYPRVFFIELEFSGELCREALEAAWQGTLARHPMVNSLIARQPGGWRWTGTSDRPPAISWLDSAAPLTFSRGEMIDLIREPGLRMWVRVGENRSQWILEFHHACVDGVGGFQFVADLMASYARETSDHAPQLAQLDPALLVGRGTFGLARPTFREWLGHAAYTIRDSLRLVGRKILPLSAARSAPSELATPVGFGGIETFTSSADELNLVRRQAEAAGVTINDLVMCHLLLTIIDWNTEQSGERPRGWLRINVPTNLRRREDTAMPAANVMSFTFVDRHTDQCQDARALLESIRRETEAIKGRRLGLYFIGQLALLRGIPGGMKRMLSPRRCFATAVLTNLGDVARRFSLAFPIANGKLVVGNLVMERITGTPPLRPLTRVGIGIMIYAERLVVTLSCDRHHFTQEQSRRFLEMYVARIRRGL
jgi:hypothetical protein